MCVSIYQLYLSRVQVYMSCCIVLHLKPGSCILFEQAGQWQCVCGRSQRHIRVIRAGLSAAGKCGLLMGAAFNPALYQILTIEL